MAKGWTKVRDNAIDTVKMTKAEKVIKERGMAKLIRNTPKLSAFDLKKEGEDLYDKKKGEEDKLLDAFDNKLVKSKNAIKQAIRIKKERTEAESKKLEAAKKVEDEPVTEA